MSSRKDMDIDRYVLYCIVRIYPTILLMIVNRNRINRTSMDRLMSLSSSDILILCNCIQLMFLGQDQIREESAPLSTKKMDT